MEEYSGVYGWWCGFGRKIRTRMMKPSSDTQGVFICYCVYTGTSGRPTSDTSVADFIEILDRIRFYLRGEATDNIEICGAGSNWIGARGDTMRVVKADVNAWGAFANTVLRMRWAMKPPSRHRFKDLELNSAVGVYRVIECWPTLQLSIPHWCCNPVGLRNFRTDFPRDIRVRRYSYMQGNQKIRNIHVVDHYGSYPHFDTNGSATPTLHHFSNPSADVHGPSLHTGLDHARYRIVTPQKLLQKLRTSHHLKGYCFVFFFFLQPPWRPQVIAGTGVWSILSGQGHVVVQAA